MCRSSWFPGISADVRDHAIVDVPHRNKGRYARTAAPDGFALART
jgi:hypothetical protein